MKTKRHGWLSLSSLVFVASVLLNATALATPCLTMLEAKQHWPNSHLWWHQGPQNRCWDNQARGADHYDERPAVKVIIPQKLPDNMAEGSWLEKVSTHGPDAEIYYPELKPGSGLDSYPILIWPQPWLSPVSMLSWPQLVDIDRKPFVAWDRRIGQ